MEEWATMKVLKSAHLAGLAMTESLAGAAEDLKRGQRAEALGVFERALEFFESDLQLHFDHEERALFPVLARIIGRAGPIGAMEGEHESFWRCVDDFTDEVGELRSKVHDADRYDGAELLRLANHIVWMLRGHIQREDTMLFPLAEKSLDDRGRREVDLNLQIVDRLALASS